VEGVPLAFRRRFWRDDDFRAQSLFCHRQLAVALRDGEVAMARAVMDMHIQGAMVYLRGMRDLPN
jgi:DNA-binding GntR family transcriptional regulator